MYWREKTEGEQKSHFQASKILPLRCRLFRLSSAMLSARHRQHKCGCFNGINDSNRSAYCCFVLFALESFLEELKVSCARIDGRIDRKEVLL